MMTMPAKERIAQMPVDETLVAGAQNAVVTCLRIQPHEKTVIITDEQTLDIAAALFREVEAVGALLEIFIIEDYVPRPCLELPPHIMAELEKAQIGIYCVYPQKGEIVHRMAVTDVVERNKIRYAHMVGITRDLMTQGMRADFRKVDAISLKVQERASQTGRIEVKTANGTHLTGSFQPQRLKWIKTSGIISPLYWGNLPGGEVFTCPERVDGIFVADGSIGDYFGQRYGDLIATPLKIEIVNNLVVGAHSELPGLAQEFMDYVRSTPNGDRVGEFAIGTNLNVFEITGNLLQDEKIPGVHIAFGNPYGSQTGADWTAKVHIDVICRNSNIWMDGEQIMENGIFLADRLGFEYGEGLDLDH